MREQRITYCRLCEAACGLVASVEDGRILRLAPDHEHVVSRGFSCPKGVSAHQITHDPDRILHPQKREGGEWRRISWESALSEIGERLTGIRDRHGPNAIGIFSGNPNAYSYSARLFATGFADAIGTRNVFGSASQDNLADFLTSRLLYGAPLLQPIPDVDHTRFLLVVGGNPAVSQGTLIHLTDARRRLAGIRERGGKLVVIDPRRSETAEQADEHHWIRPDSDAFLLLAMLHTIFAEGLEDARFLREHTSGAEELRRAVASHDAARAEAQTGILAETIRRLARELAGADGGCVYGRPICGSFGTLTNWALDVLNVVTGNLDRPGGAVFSQGLVDTVALTERAVGGRAERSRIGGFARLVGQLPAGILADEIATPGEEQIRALVVCAGNPVLSIANGPALAEAMRGLECRVAIDVYRSETASLCDYLLPATTFLEREDFPLFHSVMMSEPYAQFVEPVIPPCGEARPEWQIFTQLSDAMGLPLLGNPMLQRVRRLLGRRFTPRLLLDAVIRLGPHGDRYLPWKRGLSLKALAAHPHGLALGPVRTGVLAERLRTPDRKVRLWSETIASELARFARAAERSAREGTDRAYPLRLIGRRDLRSANSWLHNVPKLMAGDRCRRLRMHPQDAHALGLADGDRALVRSRVGKISAEVRVTDEVMPGVVSLPHGWGHTYPTNRSVATRDPGPDYNALIDARAIEPAAGMAFLNGFPVAVERMG